ncbi:beta-ketoacyl synthase N-terminal-like domain-containing protein [Streptomyces zagrosensis]|uniref:Beta-ketoacyl synthase-like N-terminal domain-containing protein n=1 Tax=Streptomyces zagrosensis TaxID=1042984 RepID=A0A7W9V2P2_9ACTN|nr:beta-ketoacyl synthase N-terminal-like domain-containing protein [Streptomyces zagrosensis]MBB5940172.1 hypothetical protein [Streptomyces zagrosensis]
MSTHGRPLAAITGIGPVTRPAIGVKELAEVTTLGIRDDERTTPALPLTIDPMDTFHPADFLGKRGWKFFPEPTRAALAAVRLALADAKRHPDTMEPEERTEANARTGVVIGTNFAVDAIVDRIDRALIAEGIPGISPVECPNFSVNVPAGQLAIAGGFKAFNITLVDLLTAGYEALLLGARALVAGRADSVLAGTIEGPPPTAAQPVTGPRADAFGACLFHLEPQQAAAERRVVPYAYLTGGTRRMLPDEPHHAARVLGSALDRLGGADGVDQLHLCLPPYDEGARAADAARAWVAARGAGTEVTIVQGAPQATGTSALALGRQLAREVRGTAVFGAMGPQGNVTLLHLTDAGGK